jgi:tetratricopeptide (TPR) repeat protein
MFIRFNTREELKEFLLDLLELRQALESAERAKRKSREQKDTIRDIVGFLDGVEGKGAFYRMERTYYYGRVRRDQEDSDPASPVNIFSKGVRSLHTQKSYKLRPGEWLGIQLRNTDEGRRLGRFIKDRVPAEHVGTNVPIPERVLLKREMRFVTRVIDGERNAHYATRALCVLNKVKEKAPDLFRGQRAYLWEDMARLFDELGDITNAVYCLEQMAELRPKNNEPYLNMGVMLAAAGDMEGALAAYAKGLVIDPRDEYISFNLASLLMQEENSDVALKYVEEAIAANPGRGLNYKLKGDIHLSRQDYFAAIAAYKQALPLFDETWKMARDECLLHLAAAREDLKNSTDHGFKHSAGVERLSISYEEGVGVAVEISEKLRERIELCKKEHACNMQQRGIGVGEAYSVTETSIGTMISVQCCCGERLLVYPDDPLEF